MANPTIVKELKPCRISIATNIKPDFKLVLPKKISQLNRDSFGYVM